LEREENPKQQTWLRALSKSSASSVFHEGCNNSNVQVFGDLEQEMMLQKIADVLEDYNLSVDILQYMFHNQCVVATSVKLWCQMFEPAFCHAHLLRF